jgi:hypothetical protein
VTRIELAPEVGDDIGRILEYLYQYELADAPSRIDEIIQGISVLEYNPLVGRVAQLRVDGFGRMELASKDRQQGQQQK